VDFSLSEEQELLRRTARDFVASECPRALVRQMEEDDAGYSPELWRKMADLGWIGLLMPQECGGSEGSFLDFMVLLEEMARGLVPGPLVSTALCASTILDLGSARQKRELLPGVAGGELIMTYALDEADGRYEASAIKSSARYESDFWIIDGTKMFVGSANVADYLLCVVGSGDGVHAEDGVSLFLVDPTSPGVVRTALSTVGRDRQSRVDFAGVRVPTGNMLGRRDEAWPHVDRLIQKAAVAKCVEMVGQLEEMLQMTVDYARQRAQFGRPIGSFQAIQHHCANMKVDLDGSRFIAYQAAWKLSQDLPCRAEVSMAKAWVSDAAERTVALAHQVHGGVGLISEHDLPLYSRRATAARVLLGDADYHRTVVARELGLA